MIRKKDGLIEDEQFTSLYKQGFSYIAEFVERVDTFTTESANVLVDTYREVNNQQLHIIRQEREELKNEIKRFLVRANSKMAYLVQLEEHLLWIDESFKATSKMAFAEEADEGDAERGEQHEEETPTDTDRQSS
ncbi:hypothetical protein V3851_07340 [Paenibacillus sp. M1]|uniref:Uncharacterized protein n=1 Tax=Paenibacillus haidiansis TaxID=1574488 RepID=A0ABU7VRY9_9BACL